MYDPIAAVSAIGPNTAAAATPDRGTSARLAVPPHSMAASLQALHDAGSAQDFAAHFNRPAVSGASSASAPSFLQPLRESLQNVMNRDTAQVSRTFDTTPTDGRESSLQVVERMERVSNESIRLNAQITRSQIEFSLGLGLATSLIDTAHSLLKSNE